MWVSQQKRQLVVSQRVLLYLAFDLRLIFFVFYLLQYSLGAFYSGDFALAVGLLGESHMKLPTVFFSQGMKIQM